MNGNSFNKLIANYLNSVFLTKIDRESKIFGILSVSETDKPAIAFFNDNLP